MVGMPPAAAMFCKEVVRRWWAMPANAAPPPYKTWPPQAAYRPKKWQIWLWSHVYWIYEWLSVFLN